MSSAASPEALCLEGNRALDAGRVDDAIRAYDAARAMTTDHAALLNNIGNAWHQAGEFSRALGFYLEAALAEPRSPQILTHLGVTLAALRQHDAAFRCFSAALARQNDYASARWNRGLLKLLKGDWPGGWDDFEWRWKVPRFAPNRPGFGLPEWRNVETPPRHILLYSEQGYGDVLQFVRYVDRVRELKSSITLIVPRALSRIIGHSFPDCRVLTDGDAMPKDMDAQASLMSLPALFRTTLTTIPSRHPYLSVQPTWRPAKWSPSSERRRVGLVWAGSRRAHDAHASAVDRRRSLSLGALAPLAEISGVDFVSLQKEIPTDDRALMAGWLSNAAEEAPDFAATAAIIEDLDLVISVDTAVAHLAAAVGKPVWILSRYDGCWRWLENRQDTPWYPTARLFRQGSPGDWGSVITDVVRALGQWVRDTNHR